MIDNIFSCAGFACGRFSRSAFLHSVEDTFCRWASAVFYDKERMFFSYLLHYLPTPAGQRPSESWRDFCTGHIINM